MQKILDERKKFWLDIYPKMNIQEKKEYWLSSTHKGMRLQAESFADPYSEFSKKWYDFAKVMSQNLMIFLIMLLKIWDLNLIGMSIARELLNSFK